MLRPLITEVHVAALLLMTVCAPLGTAVRASLLGGAAVVGPVGAMAVERYLAGTTLRMEVDRRWHVFRRPRERRGDAGFGGGVNLVEVDAAVGPRGGHVETCGGVV